MNWSWKMYSDIMDTTLPKGKKNSVYVSCLIKMQANKKTVTLRSFATCKATSLRKLLYAKETSCCSPQESIQSTWRAHCTLSILHRRQGWEWGKEMSSFSGGCGLLLFYSYTSSTTGSHVSLILLLECFLTSLPSFFTFLLLTYNRPTTSLFKLPTTLFFLRFFYYY